MNEKRLIELFELYLKLSELTNKVYDNVVFSRNFENFEFTINCVGEEGDNIISVDENLNFTLSHKYDTLTDLTYDEVLGMF